MPWVRFAFAWDGAHTSPPIGVNDLKINGSPYIDEPEEYSNALVFNLGFIPRGKLLEVEWDVTNTAGGPWPLQCSAMLLIKGKRLGRVDTEIPSFERWKECISLKIPKEDDAPQLSFNEEVLIAAEPGPFEDSTPISESEFPNLYVGDMRYAGFPQHNRPFPPVLLETQLSYKVTTRSREKAEFEGVLTTFDKYGNVREKSVTSFKQPFLIGPPQEIIKLGSPDVIKVHWSNLSGKIFRWRISFFDHYRIFINNELAYKGVQSLVRDETPVRVSMLDKGIEGTWA